MCTCETLACPQSSGASVRSSWDDVAAEPLGQEGQGVGRRQRPRSRSRGAGLPSPSGERFPPSGATLPQRVGSRKACGCPVNGMPHSPIFLPGENLEKLWFFIVLATLPSQSPSFEIVELSLR